MHGLIVVKRSPALVGILLLYQLSHMRTSKYNLYQLDSLVLFQCSTDWAAKIFYLIWTVMFFGKNQLFASLFLRHSPNIFQCSTNWAITNLQNYIFSKYSDLPWTNYLESVLQHSTIFQYSIIRVITENIFLFTIYISQKISEWISLENCWIHQSLIMFQCFIMSYEKIHVFHFRDAVRIFLRTIWKLRKLFVLNSRIIFQCSSNLAIRKRKHFIFVSCYFSVRLNCRKMCTRWNPWSYVETLPVELSEHQNIIWHSFYSAKFGWLIENAFLRYSSNLFQCSTNWAIRNAKDFIFGDCSNLPWLDYLENVLQLLNIFIYLITIINEKVKISSFTIVFYGKISAWISFENCLILQPLIMFQCFIVWTMEKSMYFDFTVQFGNLES